MHNFYVSKIEQEDGRYEVHTGACIFLPRRDELCISLGEHAHCSEAMVEAKKYYKNSNGCFLCCHNCNVKVTSNTSVDYEKND